jgi:tyrosinase
LPTLTRYDITDLNNGKIDGFSVEDPPGWDAISLYYAKALQGMGYNPSGKGDAPDAPAPKTDMDAAEGTPNPANTWTYSESPESYYFWGAMHWWPGKDWEYFNENAPSPQNEYWSHCTHGPATVEKYFLPWHRAYIYFYEVIIRAKVAELGGPDDWALPYWNYSYYDASSQPDPWTRSGLPWVFCQAELPDRSPNPLFLDATRRGLQPTWPDGQPMHLSTLTPYYDQAYGQRTWLPLSRQVRGFNWTLDGQPHGAVHNDTGSGDSLISATGWMQYTQLAGFDPIFWLHHSEIDRFWVGWNAGGGQDPNAQTDPAWADASDDKIKTRWNFWKDGNIENVVVVKPGEMIDPANLDPSKFPYSYEFQNLPEPPPRQPGPAIAAKAVSDMGGLAQPAAAAPTEAVGAAAGAAPAEAAGTAAPEASARELGSSDEPVEVHHDPVTTRVSLPPEAPDLLRGFDADVDETPPRVYLHLDDVIAKGPAGNYEVYLNNTDVDRETAGQVPHYVGLLSSFGANHSHGGGHGPHGVSAVFDITELVAYLRAQGEWDESNVSVTIVPAVRPRAGLEPVIAPVSVGSISIVTA